MIYLLTYDKPHRKTQDLIFRLGKSIDVTLVTIPWIERKTINRYTIQNYLQHRSNQKIMAYQW